jgi:hypothetical protein
LKRYDGPKARKSAAENPETPLDELRELARSDLGFVRAAVAANPNVTAEIIESLTPFVLTSDDDYLVTSVLARRIDLPTTVQKRILRLLDPELEKVQPRDFYRKLLFEKVFENESFDLSDQTELLENPQFPTFLKIDILSTKVRREIAQQLVSDKSERVRDKAGRFFT